MFPIFIPIFISKEDWEKISDINLSLPLHEKLLLILSAILSWLGTYFVLGYLRGFDTWGLKGVSFVLGNFLVAPVWLILCFLIGILYKGKD